jgi:hypothetical protein
MRLAYFLVGFLGFGVAQAEPRPVRTTKKQETFQSPKDLITLKRNRKFSSADEFNGYMWNFSRETMGDDVRLRKLESLSETDPFWMRRAVWADATMPWRMAEFGSGKLTSTARQRPTLDDRDAASRLPEREYATKDSDDAILATAYRHFFDYRSQGLGREARDENAKLKVGDVYFLGLGPHLAEAPPSLIAALQNDPDIRRDKITLRPLKKVLEVTGEAIRDRDTGAYGPAFRVDDIGRVDKGEVKVMVTLGEREGFWFTRELTMRQGKAGWEVTKDSDYAIP